MPAKKIIPLEHKIRIKKPSLCFKADHKNSRSAAIRAYCLGCMNDSPGEVSRCPSYECFLWPYRSGSGVEKRPAGKMISEEKYKNILLQGASSARIEQGRRLAKKRWEEDDK